MWVSEGWGLLGLRRVCLFNDSGVDALMGFLAEAGTKVYHHGGVKKVILPKLRKRLKHRLVDKL